MVPDRLPASAEGLVALQTITLELVNRGLALDRVLGRETGLVGRPTMGLGMQLVLGQVGPEDIEAHLEALRSDEQRIAHARQALLRDHDRLSAVLRAEETVVVDARALMVRVYLEQMGAIPADGAPEGLPGRHHRPSRRAQRGADERRDR